MKNFALISGSVIVASLISATVAYKVASSKAPTESLSQAQAEAPAEDIIWTCSMHPQIKLKDKVPCPICAMELIPLKKGAGAELTDSQIAMSPLAEKLASIETWPVERKSTTLQVKLPGKVNYDESKVKQISARFAGRLERLYLDITGAPVKTNEHLFDIYSPQAISAQEEYLQTLKNFNEAQNSNSPIVKETAELTLKASEDKLKLWGFNEDQFKALKQSQKVSDSITTHSPLTGIVVKKHVNEGTYVKEGSAVYTIADLSTLWIELEAYETDLPWIHYAQKVTLKTQAYPDKTFEGQVSFIDTEINQVTRTIKVRVNFDNKDKVLKPGMFIRAEITAELNQYGQLADSDLSGKFICPMHPEIISDKNDNCSRCGMKLDPAEKLGFAAKAQASELPLIIPNSATLITGQRAIVYVKVPKKEGVYEGREIEIAARTPHYTLVKSGLKEGELVVKQGAFKIDSALQIQAKKSMMTPGDAKDQLGKEQNEFFTRPELKGNHPFKDELKYPLNHLTEINKQLSLDNIKELKSLSQNLHSSIEELSFDTLSKKEKESWEAAKLQALRQSQKLAKAKTIEEARQIIEAINIIAIKAIKAFGSPVKVNIAYCPMAFDDKGAEWLQNSDKIENPYFGSMMYRCGEFRPESPVGPMEEKFPAKELKDKTDNKPGALFIRPELKGKHPFNAQLKAPLNHLISINTQLSLDKITALNFESLALKKSMGKISYEQLSAKEQESWKALKNDALKIIDKLAQSKDIKAARVELEKLNIIAIKTLKVFGSPIKVNIAYCSMAFDDKGAEWLQLADEVENPYWGSQMYRCGSIRKTLSGNPIVPMGNEPSSGDAKHQLGNEPMKQDHSEHSHD